MTIKRIYRRTDNYYWVSKFARDCDGSVDFGNNPEAQPKREGSYWVDWYMLNGNGTDVILPAHIRSIVDWEYEARRDHIKSQSWAAWRYYMG